MKRIFVILFFLCCLTGESFAQNKSFYKVGDYYNDGTKEGVVFDVAASGRRGKIVSLTHSDIFLSWAVNNKNKHLIGANSIYDGKVNTRIVMGRAGWRNNYPAFAWCADLGLDWYLPAQEEIKTLLLKDDVRDAVNRTLEMKGGKLLPKSGEMMWYWTSTEHKYYSKGYSAIHVRTSDGYVGPYPQHGELFVRAVATFDLGDDTPADSSATPKKSKSASGLMARAYQREANQMDYEKEIDRKDYISPRELIYTPMALFTSRDIPMEAVHRITASAKGVKKCEVKSDKYDSEVHVTPEGFYLRVRGYDAMPCRYMTVTYDNDNLDKMTDLYFNYAMPKGWRKGDIAKYAKAISEDINILGAQMKKRSWSGGSIGYQCYYQGHTISIMYSTKYIKYLEPTISVLITYDKELK